MRFYTILTVVYHSSTNPAGQIWANLMTKIHYGLEPTIFEVPEGVSTLKVCKTSGKIAGSRCWSTYQEVFAEDNMPETCTSHSYSRSNNTSTNTTQTSTNTVNIVVTDESTGNTTTVQVPAN